jgi:hypothetical protein
MSAKGGTINSKPRPGAFPFTSGFRYRSRAGARKSLLIASCRLPRRLSLSPFPAVKMNEAKCAPQPRKQLSSNPYIYIYSFSFSYSGVIRKKVCKSVRSYKTLLFSTCKPHTFTAHFIKRTLIKLCSIHSVFGIYNAFSNQKSAPKVCRRQSVPKVCGLQVVDNSAVINYAHFRTLFQGVGVLSSMYRYM